MEASLKSSVRHARRSSKITRGSLNSGFAVTEFVIVTVVLVALVGSLMGAKFGEEKSLGEKFLEGLETIYNTTAFVLSLP
jgi:hypothetical protein